MTKRCSACGKPIRPQDEFYESEDVLYVSYADKHVYCDRCYSDEIEPLALWMDYIDALGGVQNIPEYKTEYWAWTGSYVNGRQIGWGEIVEEYIKHVARREDAP